MRLRVARRVREGCHHSSLPSEPCVRLSPHTAQAGSFRSPASRFWSPRWVTVTGSSQRLPFPHRSKRLPGLGRAHQTHVSTVSSWAEPYPAGYDFPLPFGRWPSLLGSSCPAGDWPPLRSVDCLTAGSNGVPTFRAVEMRPGRVPAIPARDWCPRSGRSQTLPPAIGNRLTLSLDRRVNRFRRPPPGLITGSLAFTRPVFP